MLLHSELRDINQHKITTDFPHKGQDPKQGKVDSHHSAQKGKGISANRSPCQKKGPDSILLKLLLRAETFTNLKRKPFSVLISFKITAKDPIGS